MDSTEPRDSNAEPAPTSGPLTDLVDDKLNKPLPDQIAEELEKREGPTRSGASDYASGTAEHEDEPDA